MNKCCKCKPCQSYEDAIQIDECPFINEMKGRFEIQDMMYSNHNRLVDKQIDSLSRRIDYTKEEINKNIDDVEFNCNFLVVSSVILNVILIAIML